MDMSLLNDEAMDDSFLVIRPEAMDDEVTQIFKKWKLNNPMPKKDVENINTVNVNGNNETNFDSRTFTRPPKRRTFNISESNNPSLQTCSSDMQSMESGIASINLQVGGAYTPLSMQRSWLNDVSPPSSICTSMDFQNNDNMLNSLITSSDFTGIQSFLLNGSVYDNNNPDQTRRLVVQNNNQAATSGSSEAPPNNNLNVTQNLINFTFDINKTITNTPVQPNSTFKMSNTYTTTDSEPIKEIGIENADMQLNVSTEDFGKNLTFNKYECNVTWDKIQSQNFNNTVIQSTPVHNPENNDKARKMKDFDDTISPISSLINAQDDQDDEDDEILLRNFKGRKLVNDITMDDYRKSIEDQCEFLLNEETIKLSTRVLGESFECLNLRNALLTDANEKEFDEMLDTFNITKSKEGDKLKQSVDSIKQRHSLINMEKLREEKLNQKMTDCEANDNRTQYDTMNKSSERLLNRRSRLFDDVNLQLQRQQQIDSSASTNGASGSVTSLNEPENDEVIDKNDRDRFKTIKLSRPRLQTGMVIVNTEELPTETAAPKQNEISPGSNKERRNQMNQQRQQQEEESNEFKKPQAPASKLSKFGFSRPTFKARNDLSLPLKASSIDSLDNDSTNCSSNGMSRRAPPNLKSPMGIKSKSIHNLMFNGSAQNGIRMTSNLKLNPETTRSQSNLKAPRASSLVRPSVDTNFKIPQSFQQQRAPANRKTAGLVRPSSGYYGNGVTKRLDSDNESYSLSSSSASSRNSVHLSLAPEQQLYHQNSMPSNEELDQPARKPAGAVPKPSGIARPMSGLPRPQVKSGLPRPKR